MIVEMWEGRVEVFKNANFTKRDPECTSIVAAVAESEEALIATREAGHWFRTDADILSGLTHLWTIRGVTFYGYL